jgi:hypothetical protein
VSKLANAHTPSRLPSSCLSGKVQAGVKAWNTKGESIDWFGISCMTTDNFCFHLQNRLIQTSQTGGQRYSDTPPLIIQGKRVWQSETTYLIAKLGLHRRTVVGENASESKSCSACLGTLGVLAGIDTNLYIGVTPIDILFWVD